MMLDYARGLHRTSLPAYHVELETPLLKRKNGLPSYESGRTGDERSLHALKFGYSRSFTEMAVTSSGHLIPKAGSSHRTPAAASGL